MKKIIFTSAFLLCTFFSFSQQMPERKPLTAEQIAQRKANALSQRLSLTEDQRSKAYTIFLDKAKKDLAAREALMKEMQKQRQQADAEAKLQNDKLSQLLNADQKKTFQDMQSRLNERSGGNSPRMRPGPQQRGFGFHNGPGDRQFQGPGNPGSRFQRPGSPGSRFQPGPHRQFQQPNMRPDRRPGGQGGFQQRPEDQDFRPFFRERLQRFQNRMNQQPGGPQTTPDNNQPNNRL
jgi:protein CpxP